MRAPGDCVTLAHHWELCAWILVRLAALSRGKWAPSEEPVVALRVWAPYPRHAILVRKTFLYIPCVCPLQSSGDPVAAMSFRDTLVRLLKLARQACGDTRGSYPILHDIPCMPQAPIMHCTGKVAMSLVFFGLTVMSINSRDAVRLNIYKVMGRANMGGMYSSEFGRVVAHITAVRGVLGVPMEAAVMGILRLSQLLTEWWRRAVSRATPNEREDAAATLQYTTVFAPLYASMKPFDPETKEAGVFNFYLHTATSDVRAIQGKAFRTARHICDDNIEGKIAELKTHFNTRSNNVSRGETLITQEATQPMQSTTPQERTAVEMMIYTEKFAVCKCIPNLGCTVRDDLNHCVKMAETDPYFLTEKTHAATTEFF